jgi:hypothetical protein
MSDEVVRDRTFIGGKWVSLAQDDGVITHDGDNYAIAIAIDTAYGLAVAAFGPGRAEPTRIRWPSCFRRS